MKSWETVVVVISVVLSLVYTLRRIRLYLLGKAGCACDSDSKNKSCSGCVKQK